MIPPVLRAAALAFAFVVAPAAPAQPARLADIAAPLDVDVQRISVSGISSGAYMAQQFHVAHSAHLSGAGIIAGGPYRCAAGVYRPYAWFDVTGLYAATSRCSDTNPYWIFQGPPDVEFSLRATRDEAAAGGIDDPSALRGDRVWLFSGGKDETVPAAVVDALERYYREFVDATDIRHQRLPAAGHAMITLDFGTACGLSQSPFVSDCDYDAAGELLRHIHGALHAPAAPDSVQPATAFDQESFFDRDDPSVSMHAVGQVYVPRACRGGARCALHVAFHGCRQTQDDVGDAFYAHAGYNRWAESNGIVVLYPQAVAWSGGVFAPGGNPKGCWDWWGYSGTSYHRKAGKQVRAVAAMINALVHANLLATP